MARKKKVQPDLFKEWEAKSEVVKKEIEELKRYTDDVQWKILIMNTHLKDLKESDPRLCKNCKYKDKCPWVKEGERIMGDPEDADWCLKIHCRPGQKNNRWRSTSLIDAKLFLN